MNVSVITTKFAFTKYYGIFLSHMILIHFQIQDLTKPYGTNIITKKKRSGQFIIQHSVVKMHLIINKIASLWQKMLC